MAVTTQEAEKYDALEKIGQGSFGIIRKVRRISDGALLVRKEISYQRMNQQERNQLYAEITILADLHHENIVRYYAREHVKNSQDMYIYMEYCGSGDLGMVIRKHKTNGRPIPEDYVWRVLAQLVCALFRCHHGKSPPGVGQVQDEALPSVDKLRTKLGARMILHRDLKPENVFLSDNDTVKLGDFGLSKDLHGQKFTQTYVGTPFYMSPEICTGETYTSSSDIWALGCLLHELCTLSPPFNGKSHPELAQKILKGGAPRVDSRYYSSDLQNTIDNCLQVNPTRRPDTKALLEIQHVRIQRRELNLLIREAELAPLRETLERERKVYEKKYADIDASLHRQWEMKARLAIDKAVQNEAAAEKKRVKDVLLEENAQLVAAEIAAEKQKLQEIFEAEVSYRVEIEVTARLSSLPSSANTSMVESRGVSGDTAQTSVFTTRHTRSLTPTSSFEDLPPTSALIPGIDEDELAPRDPDLSALSLEDPESPLTQKHQKPPQKRLRAPLGRARTVANSNPFNSAASPMDVQMGDPSPMPPRSRSSLAGLSLSPRRHAQAPPSSRRNDFIVATNAPLFPAVGSSTHLGSDSSNSGSLEEEDSFDHDVPSELPSPSRRQEKENDPFKVLARPSTGLPRPGLMRQKTMPAPMTAQGCLTNQPSLFSTRQINPNSGAESTKPAGSVPVVAASPQRRNGSKPAVSPTRRAPPPPAQLSPTAKALAGKTGIGKEGLGRAMFTKKLGDHITGRTLVELSQARNTNIFSEAAAKAGEGENAKALDPPPQWNMVDEEDMPSPFLCRRKNIGLMR
ncbi:G2-specific serine/threonine protein kinase [Elasticomyces elasticus]|nr:G2-specific serine/threonine protein kinase [Elasticomyces elasticus]